MRRLRTRLRTASSGNGPFPGSALYVNFLAGAQLDSRITFSRGSNATRVDATGKIVYAPANLLLYSQDFDNSAWVKTGATISPNTTTAPDGTSSADALVEDASTGNHWLFQSLGTAAAHSFSVYLKAGIRSWAALRVSLTGPVVSYAYFNLSTGVVGTVAAGLTATISPAGDGWYRCTIFGTLAGSIPVLIAAASADGVTTYTGTNGASGVFLWGAQLEPVTYQTTPSTYVATTASAYYGPRFDYDPVTLAPKGLLIEEARTNLLTYSDQFDNAAWIKLNATVTANGTASPDGTTNADKLVEDATNSVHIVYQGPAFAGSTTYTVSLFAKAAERSKLDVFCNGISATATNLFEVTFDLSNGTFLATQGTATITPFGNGWYRCTVTNTYAVIGTSANIQLRLNNGTTTSYAGTPGFGMFLWGAGLEAGSFATSYIPTVASTVTRSADVATMTGTNFSSWYNQSEGSFVVSYSRIQTVDTSAMVLEVKPTSISTTDRINISNSNLTDPRFQVFVGGVSQLDTTTTFGTLPVGTGVNAALAYKSGDNAAVRNGSAPVTSASTFTAPSYTNMQIGGTDNSIFGAAATTLLNGHIRQIAYYNTRLPNAQLQTLTAPSLATTLSLSFINQSYAVGV